jgi:hypothetical protein
MQPFAHIARHAPRTKGEKMAVVHVAGPGQVVYQKKRLDLRTGIAATPFRGFFPAPDGVVLDWVDRHVEAVHPGGQRARLEAPVRLDPKFAGPSFFTCVGPFLVGSVRADEPWMVFDLRTGKATGPLEGQRPDLRFGAPCYAPNGWFAHDGLAWFNELERLVAFDLATRRIVREVPAPEGCYVVAFTVMDDQIVGNVRPAEAHNAYRRTEDRIAALGPDGAIRWEVARRSMSHVTVGERVVVSAHDEMELLVFDAGGTLLQTLPFVDPNTKSPFAKLVPMPGGREFLSIGGNSEWDHWGEPGVQTGA